MRRSTWLTLGCWAAVAGWSGAELVAHSTSAGAVAGVQAAETKELTTAEHTARLKRRAAHAEDRVESARKLGGLREAAEIRDNKVVETLLEIAINKDENLFVRMECVAGLGEIQYQVFGSTKEDYAVNKYLDPFITLLKDKDGEALLRTSVAKVFVKTLKSDRVKHGNGLDALLVIAEDKDGIHSVKPTPVILRIECVNALGSFGSLKAFETFATILVQEPLDPLLRESTVRGMSTLISSVDLEGDVVKLPTVNRIAEMIKDKKMTVDVRAEALKLLARLKGANPRSGGNVDLQAIIQKILTEETNAPLIIAAIQALGYMNDESGVDGLVKAYNDFFDAKAASRSNDVAIRQEVVKTMGHILDFYTAEKKPANPATLKKIVEVLLRTLDTQADPKEVTPVQLSAVFSLRYLYPLDKGYDKYQHAAIERLIQVVKAGIADKDKPAGAAPADPAPAAGAAKKATVDEEVATRAIDTLTILTRKPFGPDVARWEEWWDSQRKIGK